MCFDMARGAPCLDCQITAKWSKCLTEWCVDAIRKCVGRGGNGGNRCASPAARAFGTLTTTGFGGEIGSPQEIFVWP
jgi:hypothetical protein